MLRGVLLFVLIISLSACEIDGLQLRTAPDWSYRSLVAWKHADPRGLVMSVDQHYLYIAADVNATAFGVSLMVVNMKTGHHQILIYGMNKASVLALAPDSTLWLGEAFDDGLIWRITSPHDLPQEQQIQRLKEKSESPAIATLRSAGVFNHQTISFSADGVYAYLADASEGGALYRFNMRSQNLQVWHQQKHWLAIDHPDEAPTEARQKEARAFDAIRGMTRMDDARLLLAESGSGRILVLQDGEKPSIESWLENSGIQRPNSIAWDTKRQWLWISDEGKSSWLWAWDGRYLQDIAHHNHGVLSGVHVNSGRVFVNVRRKQGGPEAVIEIFQKHATNDD
ncbi:MAG: hypothetical protein Q9M22_07055 [Mariprofundaceae bacterium]|nr:hypothetical protein [Mariprofundaceae bacterium]